MEYITSGDRIAVENFEIGSIYKVTFLNETEVYFMCCGKGKDFVMMMSNEPRLFSLTMSSAAEVYAIDDYTPLPPPPTNLLQYQTGEPPFTFTTKDTELFSWYIKGPAGDKTANLFDGTLTTMYPDGSNTIRESADMKSFVIAIKANETITYSNIYSTSFQRMVITDDYPENMLPFSYADRYDFTGNTASYTNTENYDRWLLICPYRASVTTYTVDEFFENVMVNSGSTALPYEPYGYKIPILCNTTLSNIYINEALGENDILYSTDTTYTIATELGENLLQVQGETQPSEMQIVYKWEFEYE